MRTRLTTMLLYLVLPSCSKWVGGAERPGWLLLWGGQRGAYAHKTQVIKFNA